MRRFVIAIMLFVSLISVPSEAQVNKSYFVWKGRDMVMDSRYREAIETLNILLRADPDSYEGFFWRGVAKYNLDDLLGAERDFSATLNINPVYTVAYYFRGLVRSRLGNYDDAFSDFAEAIDLRPDNPAPYFSRGVAEILTQRYQAAVDDFNAYIRLNNRDADAYANRGMAYLYLKDTLAAQSDFDRAVRTNTNYPRGYLERGSLAMARRNYNDAAADFSRAIECDSLCMPAYFNRALSRYNLKDIRGALSDFDTILEFDPSSSVTYFNRALLRTETGDYNRALDDYNAAAEITPGNIMIYYNRAALNLRLGNLSDALSDYNRTIELLPDFAGAYRARASVRYLLKDFDGAQSDERIAQAKIDYYNMHREGDGTDPVADTTRLFDQLLSFDAKMSNAAFARTNAANAVTLRPLYGFGIRDEEKDDDVLELPVQSVAEFIETVGEPLLELGLTGIVPPADMLVGMDDSISVRIAQDSSDWSAYFMRGVVRALLKQYTNAISALSTAIELSPSNPMLYIARSTVEAEMTDFISSVGGEYSRLSFMDSQNSLAADYGRPVYSYDNALADLNKAAKLAPDLPYIYYNRANIAAVAGDFQSALDDYDRVIAMDPEFADAYFNRGLVRIYCGNLNDALLDISKAGELGIGEAYTLLRAYSSVMDN